MSKYIALIRHGDYQQLANTPSAHQPFPLNKRGLEQSEAGASELMDLVSALGVSIHPVIHSSNLLRAWQTAQIFAENLSTELAMERLKIVGFDELAERSVGSAANLSVEQIAEIIEQDPRFDSLPDNWKSDSYFCLPLLGAESLMQSGERVATHLTSVIQELDENQLKLVVGHGAAIRHAAFQLGVIDFEEIAQLSMYHAQPVILGFDGEWSQVSGSWKVRSPKSSFTD